MASQISKRYRERPRLPAEWEKQSCILIAWPHPSYESESWPAQAVTIFGQVAKEISSRQFLLIACKDSTHQIEVSRYLRFIDCDMDRILCLKLTYDDIWVRDTAPISVIDSAGTRFLDFGFNGWGRKYPFKQDATLSRNLANLDMFDQVALETIDFVMEGGAIDTDGTGRLIANANCLLNKNRNAKTNKPMVERLISRQLGIDIVLWIDCKGLVGDDTDGHIDTLARFCSENVIAYSACTDKNDRNYGNLKRMESKLSDLALSHRITLVALPIPAPVFNEDCEQLPANYVNFLPLNSAVLVPNFDDPADSIAMKRLQACFPGRKMIGIPSKVLIRQSGSLHCMSMHFPSDLRL